MPPLVYEDEPIVVFPSPYILSGCLAGAGRWVIAINKLVTIKAVVKLPCHLILVNVKSTLKWQMIMLFFRCRNPTNH